MTTNDETVVAPVHDNPAESRFELPLPDGDMAFTVYRRREGGVLAIIHVEVPRAYEGRGVGSAVMAGVLDRVRADGGKVVPVCSFAAAYMRRHPEVQDLLV